MQQQPSSQEQPVTHQALQLCQTHPPGSCARGGLPWRSHGCVASRVRAVAQHKVVTGAPHRRRRRWALHARQPWPLLPPLVTARPCAWSCSARPSTCASSWRRRCSPAARAARSRLVGVAQKRAPYARACVCPAAGRLSLARSQQQQQQQQHNHRHHPLATTTCSLPVGLLLLPLPRR